MKFPWNDEPGESVAFWDPSSPEGKIHHEIVGSLKKRLKHPEGRKFEEVLIDAVRGVAQLMDIVEKLNEKLDDRINGIYAGVGPAPTEDEDEDDTQDKVPTNIADFARKRSESRNEE